MMPKIVFRKPEEYKKMNIQTIPAREVARGILENAEANLAKLAGQDQVVATQPTGGVETITPSVAKKMLEANKLNRPLCAISIQRFAKQMAAGKWALNGEPIIFCRDGTLLDGQHRLLACVESNTAFPSYVIRGISKEAFATLDSGKARTNADVLSVDHQLHHGEGLPNAGCVAAVCTWLKKYESRTMTHHRGGVSAKECMEIKSSHPGIVEMCRAVASRKKLKALAQPSVTAFCFYLFSRKDPDAAHIFFDALERGTSLSEDEPVYVLRERLNKEKQIRTGKLNAFYVIAIIIKAWNLTRRGKKARLIVWKSESEPFPEVE